MTPSIHASAVLFGARAVLIRGPSGAGKSRLALRVLSEPPTARWARLVGDDRVHLEAAHGRLLVRPAPALVGRIEVRGYGIDCVPFEPLAVVGLVVDLASDDAERLPDRRTVKIDGISLPGLALPAGCDAMPALRAALATVYRSAPSG